MQRMPVGLQAFRVLHMGRNLHVQNRELKRRLITVCRCTLFGECRWNYILRENEMRVRIPPTQHDTQSWAFPRATVCSACGRLIKARTRFITPSRQPLTKRACNSQNRFTGRLIQQAVMHTFRNECRWDYMANSGVAGSSPAPREWVVQAVEHRESHHP